MLKPLTESEVTFTIEVLQAETDPEEELDAETLEYVKGLMAKTVWGWCDIKVIAEWKGWKASTFLGSCSYDSEKAFLEDLCAELKADVLKDLNDILERDWELLSSRIDE